MSRADDAAGGVPQQLIARDSAVLSPIVSVEPAAEAVEPSTVPGPLAAASAALPASVQGVFTDLANS